MKKLLLMVAIPLLSYIGQAQVGINNTDPKASLDISASDATNPSNTDGILIPRIEDFPSTNPTMDQHGMMVYLTTTSGSNPPGFYYWDDNAGPAAWVSFVGNSIEKIDDLTDGKSDSDGTDNGSSIFLGVNAGNNDDESNNANIGIGKDALGTNTTGSLNVAIGFQSMLFNSTGTNNTAIGYQSLLDNTTADFNTAIGTYSLYNTTSGQQNTALGHSSLFFNITGQQNTAIGYQSGNNNLGSNNVFIGYQSGYNEVGSNKFYLDNSSVGSNNALLYGEFDNNILRTNSEFQIGNPTGTGYALPTIDGALNQVFTTDGLGQVTFSDLSTLAATSASNGLTYTSGDIKLGGSLTESTTVTLGSNTMQFNMNSGGDFNINNTNIGGVQFQVDSNGYNYMSNGISIHEDTVSGDSVAYLFESGGAGNLILYNNTGDVQHNIRAGGNTVFNEYSTLFDFRVESGSEQYMLFVDGSNDAIGIGEDNPQSPLHVGISTTFDLSYANTGQDGLFLKGSGNNSGLNTVGSSIGFGPPHTTRLGQRKAAISSVQTSNDADHLGLAFYVHGNAINQSDMVERMRLNHQGYLGINNNSPSATLDVIGSMQYEDGNENSGYVLTSDALGNASWTDPSTLNTSDDDWVVSGGNVLRNSGNVLVNRANQNYKLSLGGYSIGSTISSVDIAPSNSQADAMIIMTNYPSADGLTVSQNSSYNLATRSAITTFNNIGSMTANLGYYSNVPINRSAGLYVTNPGSSSNTYGVLYEVNNTTSTGGDRYGLVADIDIDGSGGTYYGIKSDVEGLGTSAKYGVYSKVTAPSSIGYGLYSDVQSTNDYAAYLIGRTSLGLSTSNRYLMPTVDGSSGQVMTTNGSGQVSFTTINNDDHDWYEEGSTNSPNAITDDIYTQGNVAIGKTSASSPLDIEVTGAPSNLIALNIVDNSTGTGDHIGIQQTLSGTHNESIKGLETYITNSGNGLHTGISTSVQNGTGNQVGNRSTLNGSSGTNTIFSGSIFNAGTASTSTQTGLSIGVEQPTSQISYGVFNTLNASGASASGIKYGVYNLIDGGTGNHFGVYNDVRGVESNTKYGTYNLFGIGTTDTGGELYGTYNSFGSSITSTTDKYGNYTLIPAGLGGTHYGTYSDVQNASGYAGYFIGQVSLGNTSSNRYTMPAADGTANQIIQTDGAGTLSWTTPTASSTTADNALTETSGNIQLGGALTQNTTVTQGNFDLNFSLTSTAGNFIVDTNALVVEATGDVGIGVTNPLYDLHVEGYEANSYIANFDNNTNSGNEDGVAIRLQSGTSGGNHFIDFYRSGGLANSGSVRGSGAGVFYATTSDRRLKMNIIDIQSALEKIDKFQPRIYEYKEFPGKKEMGFIAQELQKVYSQSVSGDESGDAKTNPMMVDYGRLTPILTAGIQELNEKVKKLESENQQLKIMLSKYESLEARLNALEEKPNATIDVANNK